MPLLRKTSLDAVSIPNWRWSPFLDEAIEAFNQTILIERDYAEAYSNMGNALKGFTFQKPNRGLQDIIISMLDKQTYVRPSDIARAVVSLLKLEPNLQKQLQLANPIQPTNVQRGALQQETPQA